MYLLDTNACIRILNNTSSRLVSRLGGHDPTEIRLCSVVKAELLYGARHSSRVKDNLGLLSRFFEAFTSLPFNDLCAEHYGMIRSDLARSGRLIGPNDLMIASIARAHDLVLVTHDTKEMSRVVGLKLEDWE
jgi:tRNA(fMet)-specific endonuclease VapC